MVKEILINLARSAKIATYRATGALLRQIPGQRTFELAQGPLTYNQDGLATVHNCDFLNDPLFQEAYRLGEQTGSWSNPRIHWRVHVLCWAADIASRLEGDFVECGVNRGGLTNSAGHRKVNSLC
jgi:hypothetical protein